MRKEVILVLMLVAKMVMAETPTINDVMAHQRYPWNGKVDITYVISGNIAENIGQGGLMPSLKVLAIDNETSITNTAVSLFGDMSITEGKHCIVWDMDADRVLLQSTNVTIIVSYDAVPALYCTVDISSGATSQSYPTTYAMEPPDGGFNVDEFKTTKLVLRKIDAGSFLMGGQYNVTLTKPFYIGVFEVTQKQFLLITGTNPSVYKGNMRPVDSVSYHNIRGDVKGTNWPNNSDVDQSSFLGKLRIRTNLNFDLPTEAMWEYACRAGTMSKYNNGGNAESDLKLIGRYSGNVSSGKGGYTSNQTTVGSYLANAWGLYDMHGNVGERCRNWYKSSLGEGMGNGVDPKGPDTGPIGRVVRGGSCYETASCCTSSYREGKLPSNNDYSIGFRISCDCSAEIKDICFGKSDFVTIDTFSGVRNADVVEYVRYSSSWCDDVPHDTVSVVDINGEPLLSASGDGYKEWYPLSNGVYVLTYRIMSGNNLVGESITTTFRVDRVGFLSTQTTAIPVPYAWLKKCYPDIRDEFDVYESIARGESMNRFKVWECYAIGLDPRNATNEFKITSFQLRADGTPDLTNIKFEPSVNMWNLPSAKPMIMGTSDLISGEWRVLLEGDNTACRFFKIGVSLQ